jgi:phenylacetic acid degradation operon negative regulatory protein
MTAKTEELLYFLLWCCDSVQRPTFRNLTDSFEGWAYRNGFRTQLARLEKLKFLEEHRPARDVRWHRLTESGRLQALGGRDPLACWDHAWDGQWRLVVFDVPVDQEKVRKHLRRFLRSRGFGCLQNSVWITPHSVGKERELLAGSRLDVGSMILLQARPCGGETDGEIVAGAWEFSRINAAYQRYLQIVTRCPGTPLSNLAAAKAFNHWAAAERTAWLDAVAQDPLLPRALWPEGYQGHIAWMARSKALAKAGEIIRSFQAA